MKLTKSELHYLMEVAVDRGGELTAEEVKKYLEKLRKRG